MTPESKKLLAQYASAISNEVITGEQEHVSTATMRKYQAVTEAHRNALEARIEDLERRAGPARLSVDDYKVLELADLASDGAVARVLNENGKCGWTVCPTCSVDDFTHVEGCTTA